MPGIIGKKIGMTSMFSADGKNLPCTIIEAGPCVVTQVRTKENDGYEAVQLAFDERKEKNTPSAMKGHFKKAGTTPKKKLVEFHGFPETTKLGDTITVDVFKENEWIEAIGISKGMGFQGVIKRHGFSGVGGQTHGQHDRLRAPGSVGASSFPSRVFRGMRMAGRTGGNRVQIQNLTVLKIIPEKNIIILKGSVPGANNSYVILEK